VGRGADGGRGPGLERRGLGHVLCAEHHRPDHDDDNVVERPEHELERLELVLERLELVRTVDDHPEPDRDIGGIVSAALAHWSALGTTAEVAVADPAALVAAQLAVERELALIDLTCSRFRDDSELMALNAAGGAPVRVSPALMEALEAALRAAQLTGGAVDPTIGAGVAAAGYDRDFAALPEDGPAVLPQPAPGWRRLRLDRARREAVLAPPAQLDLGATAKALAADRAADAAARAAGCGVLVSLGGDVAVRGRIPGDGWPIGVADDHRERGPVPTVLVRGGGLATSSTTQRRWRRAGRTVHHILDPRTGLPPDAVWRTVSVAAASCVAANTLSTAAIVWGEDAPNRLRDAPARLVREDGEVVTVGGWPPDGDR
jgi:thiamine biosynthesis lipoprotein